MEVTKNLLRKKYSEMDTLELVKLSHIKDLSETDSKIIGEILSERIVELDEKPDEVGFLWWVTWAWLGLSVGNVYIFLELRETIIQAIIIISLNSFLFVMVLRFNKYAFLLATILSMNPVIWVANSIYLKNRWSHPKLNKI